MLYECNKLLSEFLLYNISYYIIKQTIISDSLFFVLLITNYEMLNQFKYSVIYTFNRLHAN
jgi:hypothetical protein